MSEKVLSVIELTSSIKQLLESNFSKIWVTGEISNYTHHSSGHRYFTLKDDRAQIKCVMWKGVGRSLKFEPENGMQVNLNGQVTVYEKSGQYQLISSAIMPVGIGPLELAFQQLKEKLDKEGLFADSHKQPLPGFPETIGVITSPTGAAVRDVIKVLRRRAPWIKIIIRPATVQGDVASADIAAAIREFNEFNDVDLLIVGRGGGSLEDLWAFNEEATARAIFESKIPVISAVGHQVDFTISDFVADLRAPTPSAAAEMAVPDGSEIYGFLKENLSLLVRAITGKINDLKSDYNNLVTSYGLRKPSEIINQRTQRLFANESRNR